MRKSVDHGLLIDNILESLKWNGRYQIFYGIIPVLSMMSLAMSSMTIVFIGRMVDHSCEELPSLNVTVGHMVYDVMSNSSDAQLNVTYGSCGIDVINGTDVIFTSRCLNGYRYKESTHSSFVSEWDLVCEKESLSDVSQTVDYLSEMVWATIFTRLSDIYGRKKPFMIANCTFFIISLVCSCLPNFTIYMIAKFFQTGAGLFANVIMMEMMPTKHRAVPAQIFAYIWPSSLLVLCLVAYLTREVSWRYTQMILALFSAYTLIQWWLSDESLRWLCVHNKQEEAEQLVKKMARINNVSPKEALNILRNDVFQQKLHSVDVSLTTKIMMNKFSDCDVEEDLKASDNIDVNCQVEMEAAIREDDDVRLPTIIRNKNFMKILTISCMLWFTDCMTYDGLLMTSASLAENLYLGFFLGVMLDFPSSVIFHFLTNRIGRKQCILYTHIIAGVLLVCSTIFHLPRLHDKIPYSGWIAFGFSLLARTCISISYSTVILYTPELLPTSVRSTGYGIMNGAAYIAVMISPHFRTLSRYIPWAPYIIFGSLSFITSPLILLLPETKGHELSQTIAEMDRWMSIKSVKDRNHQNSKVISL